MADFAGILPTSLHGRASVTDQPAASLSRDEPIGQRERAIDHYMLDTLRHLRGVFDCAAVGVPLPIQDCNIGRAACRNSPTVVKPQALSRQSGHAIDGIGQRERASFPNHSAHEP